MNRDIILIGFFSEDIRQEKGDTISIVGMMPDNINLALAGPNARQAIQDGVTALTKLSVYMRISFPPNAEIKSANVYLRLPNGERNQISQFSSDIVQRAKDEAAEKKSVLAGVYGVSQLIGFRTGPGTLALEFEVDGEEPITVAALNFTTSVLPQPDELSLSAPLDLALRP